MSPRAYRQSRRAEAAEQTRRRIVQATYALHHEKGVAATTFRDIATRADVGLGTVYHHFPTYDEIITACGAHTWEQVHPPDATMFDGVTSPAERIRRLVAELYAFYQRYPGMGRVREERRFFDALDAGFRLEEAQRHAIIDAAFRGLRAGTRVRAVAFALLDFTTWQNLIASGLTQDAAVAETTAILLTRLRLKGNEK